jgi:hypothetical protein
LSGGDLFLQELEIKDINRSLIIDDYEIQTVTDKIRLDNFSDGRNIVVIARTGADNDRRGAGHSGRE